MQRRDGSKPWLEDLKERRGKLRPSERLPFYHHAANAVVEHHQRGRD